MPEKKRGDMSNVIHGNDPFMVPFLYTVESGFTTIIGDQFVAYWEVQSGGERLISVGETEIQD